MRPGAERERRNAAKLMSRKNWPGAGVLEHGAVDREQDDVGRRDVERDAEDPLRAHDEGGREPRQVVAAVADEPAVRDEVAVHRVGDEQHAHHRQDRPDGAPGRDQHQRDEQHPADDVDDERREAAGDVGVEAREQRPDRDEQRRAGEPPVEQRRTLGRCAAQHLQRRPVEHERHRQHDREEDDAVLQGRHRGEHVPDRVERQQDRDGADAGRQASASGPATDFSASASTGTSSSAPAASRSSAGASSVGRSSAAVVRATTSSASRGTGLLGRVGRSWAVRHAASPPCASRMSGSRPVARDAAHGQHRAARDGRRVRPERRAAPCRRRSGGPPRERAEALRALLGRAGRLGLGREAVHQPLHRLHDDEVDDRRDDHEAEQRLQEHAVGELDPRQRRSCGG